jgi:D-alanyl-lipoteichoic acid acyltransferase DltB (MBOAT superfamily)
MEKHYLVQAVMLVVYVVISRLVMRVMRGGFREIVMAVLNLVAVYYLLIANPQYAHAIHSARTFVALFIFYIVMVLFQYVTLRFCGTSNSGYYWLAFFCPIAILLFVRHMPTSLFASLGHLIGSTIRRPPAVVGISYLTFRCARLVTEVRNGSVKMPSVCQYLSFAFFLPTMQVGPINTYANFRKGFEAAPWEVPVGRALLRILVGWIKYNFLGGILEQFSYAGFLFNGHLHRAIDLPIAMVGYYLFLYCNFSGFCDIAIGLAALIGIPVPENFDNPFAARNPKDFWNRWHITLSQWMRDMVFSPLSKYFVGKFGLKWADHAIALTIVIVFLLVGIWHGVGWNYAAYGAVHAVGVAANHYYTIFLKKRLGRERFKAYNENRWIHAAAVVLTFCFVSASMIFFANTFAQIKEMFSLLR